MLVTNRNKFRPIHTYMRWYDKSYQEMQEIIESYDVAHTPIEFKRPVKFKYYRESDMNNVMSWWIDRQVKTLSDKHPDVILDKLILELGIKTFFVSLLILLLTIWYVS